MADTSLLSYTGPVPGLVGAVTGVAALVVSAISLRRSSQSKTFDIRLELRKAIADLNTEAGGLQPLMALAKRSRTAVAAATGRHGSGAFQKWEADWESDAASVVALLAELPNPAESIAPQTLPELETCHVAVHMLRAQVEKVQEKYRSSLTADDRDRDHIRQDVRAESQARSKGRE